MTEIKKKYWIGGFAMLAVLFLAIHYLLDLDLFLSWKQYLPFLKKLSLSIFLVLMIILIGKIIERVVDSRSDTEGIRYNLLRITRLLTVIFILIVAISFLFQNLYAAAVSFGLISLVLGFALQAPITSFIAWLYIVFRRPYQVGHRIQIDGFKGDVVEINYLDTIILECSGIYLSNDRRSGRVIHFPNSLILKSQVINYNGPFEPFIWNETAIQIAYTSDLKFVEKCLLEVADKDFNSHYNNANQYSDKQWQAAVFFRISPYAWIEAVVSYPVTPKDTTGRRNRLLLAILPLITAQPEKAQFPEGISR